jgi:hypothetical protein
MVIRRYAMRMNQRRDLWNAEPKSAPAEWRVTVASGIDDRDAANSPDLVSHRPVAQAANPAEKWLCRRRPYARDNSNSHVTSLGEPGVAVVIVESPARHRGLCEIVRCQKLEHRDAAVLGGRSN